MVKVSVSLFVISLALPFNVAALDASKPEFIMPIDCVVPTQCYVQSYVDLVPGPSTSDHSCGINTYNGHKGTDFRLNSLDLMDEGIAVLSAANGMVIKVREGVRDVHMKLFDKKLTYRRGAGNFVLIDHGSGWRTMYAHMRKGSIKVVPGEKVSTGQIIGLVGLSGMTEFPHLHFEINKEGKTIDPFTGAVNDGGCRGPRNPIWSVKALNSLVYRERFLISAGFSDIPLSREALLYKLHLRKKLTRTAANIVFQVDFAGSRAGDEFSLRIFTPSGKIFAERSGLVKRDAPVSFSVVGRNRAKRLTWPVGSYRGEFILSRTQQKKRHIFIRHTQDLIIE